MERVNAPPALRVTSLLFARIAPKTAPLAMTKTAVRLAKRATTSVQSEETTCASPVAPVVRIVSMLLSAESVETDTTSIRKLLTAPSAMSTVRPVPVELFATPAKLAISWTSPTQVAALSA